MINKEIRTTIEHYRSNLPADLSALIEQGAGEISALDIVERSIKPGDEAPKFALFNQKGESRSLAYYLEKGPLVLTFYRGVWCPYCNIQLRAYNERLTDILETGSTLIAVTPEKASAIELLQKSRAPQEVVDGATTDLDFDVLHDDEGKLASLFGVEFELPKSHIDLMQALQVDLLKLTGSDRYTFPDPATYIIDSNGIVNWAFVPNNYRKRAEVEDILEALNQLKN